MKIKWFFTLRATEDVPLGTHNLTFTTIVDSVTASIQILPAFPSVSVLPIPIVVPDTGTPVTITIERREPALVDETVTLSVDHPSIATVTPSSVIIIAGQYHPQTTVQVTGHTRGSTLLQLQTSSDMTSTHIFVVPPSPLPADDYLITARPVKNRSAQHII